MKVSVKQLGINIFVMPTIFTWHRDSTDPIDTYVTHCMALFSTQLAPRYCLDPSTDW
jgi:hypothetical protein